MDVSPTSLSETERRLGLLGIHAELIQIMETDRRITLPDASVDYVHSSGVLHHVPDPLMVLREFRRVLRPGGRVRVMVYNYESLLLHLYTAYLIQLVERRYSGFDIRAAFAKCTDGEDCPISRVYKPSEFLTLASEAGFASEYVGSALSAFEASLFPQRFAAIMDQRLGQEHRDFLLALEIDKAGLPTYRGRYAGVDGCYLLKPAT
jgi:ubiquinone/menaquinone biosynthesis C-methylase UbiE